MHTIYKYTSPSNKYYIGQTVKTTQYGRSVSDGSGYKHCPAFWRAIQKYGWENFEYEVLAKVKSQEEADELEKKYIAMFQSNNPEYGYNITAGGKDSTDYEYLQRLEKMKEMWDSGATVAEIQKTFNIKKATLSYDLMRAGIDGKERIKRSAGQYLAKETYQYDLNFNLVAVYGSTGEAEKETGITNIRRACKQNLEKGKLKHKAGGFYWSYIDYPGAD